MRTILLVGDQRDEEIFQSQFQEVANAVFGTSDGLRVRRMKEPQGDEAKGNLGIFSIARAIIDKARLGNHGAIVFCHGACREDVIAAALMVNTQHMPLFFCYRHGGRATPAVRPVLPKIELY